MNAHKVSMFSVAGLGMLVLAQAAQAQAGSLIRCSSQVIGAAAIEIDRSTSSMTGTVDGIQLLSNQITIGETRHSGVVSFEFDTGKVTSKTHSGVLKQTRIHGRLDLNTADPERSMMQLGKQDSICGGISLFGHCSGGYDVLQSDSGPVALEMTCHLSK